MAIFVLPDDCCARFDLLIKTAEAAYNEWMHEADKVGDEPICDWIISQLKEKGFKYGRDYRIFTDLEWD